MWLFASLFVWDTAASTSADIELVRATTAPDSPPGLDTPRMDPPGAVRLTALAQYERAPLVLYEQGEPVGAVIGHREVLHLGAAYQIRERLAARAVLPVIHHGGGELEALSGDGFGSGDLTLGLRARLLGAGPLALAARGDAWLPTGRQERWMGEASPRGSAGLLAEVSAGRASLQVDLGVVARAPVEADYALSLGSALAGGAGLSLALWPERATLYAAALGRAGLAPVEDSSGAAQAIEALGGFRFAPRPHLRLDAGLGRGLLQGYGTTSIRAYSALSIVLDGGAPEPPPEPIDAELGQEIPADLPEAAPPTPAPAAPAAPDAPLARLEGEQIITLAPIRFERGTARLLPESAPVIEEVSRVLSDRPWIVHLVIEGHASEEGSFSYNDDLSNARARAVWRALVEAGAHPDRMSYRGMGEVRPQALGETEADRALNRRVVFRVTRLPEGAPAPEWPAEVPLPWSGELRAFEAPEGDSAQSPPAPSDDVWEEALDRALAPEGSP